MLAGLAGVSEDQRSWLWKKGAEELRAWQRLIDSPPVLTSAMLAADGVFSWTLTDEGRAFFSSLHVEPGTDARTFKEKIAAKLKSSGAFADPDTLDRTLHEAGKAAPDLVRHALWAHAIAFAAAHPAAKPRLATFFDDEDGEVEVDAPAGRVRLRSSRYLPR